MNRAGEVAGEVEEEADRPEEEGEEESIIFTNKFGEPCLGRDDSS